MQQCLGTNGKVIVGKVTPKKDSLQLLCFLNRLDNFGNFTRREVVYVMLFNHARKLAVSKCIEEGDFLYLHNADYNSFTTDSGHVNVSLVCNFANQIDIIPKGINDIIDPRKMKEETS